MSHLPTPDDERTADELPSSGEGGRPMETSSNSNAAKIERLEERLGRGERWVILLTAATTVAAIAAVVVSFLQWSVMRDQLADARASTADTRRMIAAAETQAKGLQKLADATNRMAMANERARLIVDGIICDPIVAVSSNPSVVGETWRCSVTIRDAGRTARRVSVRLAAEAVPPGGTPHLGVNQNVVIKNGTVAQEANIVTPLVQFTDARTTEKLGPITQTMLDNLAAGRLRLFIHGRATYYDDAGCRWMTFNFAITGANTDWARSPEHNDDGDGC